MKRRPLFLVAALAAACGQTDQSEQRTSLRRLPGDAVPSGPAAPAPPGGNGAATAAPGAASPAASAPAAGTPGAAAPGGAPGTPSATRVARDSWRGIYRVDTYLSNDKGCDATGIAMATPYAYLKLDWADPSSPYGDLLPFSCSDQTTCDDQGLSPWLLPDPADTSEPNASIQAANQLMPGVSSPACVALVPAVSGTLTGQALVLADAEYDLVVARGAQSDCATHVWLGTQGDAVRLQAAAGQLPCDHATSMHATWVAALPAVVDANPDGLEIYGIQGPVAALTDVAATRVACAASQVGKAGSIIGQLVVDAQELYLCGYATGDAAPILASDVLPEAASMPGYGFAFGYALYVAGGRTDEVQIAYGTLPGGPSGDALLVTRATQADGTVAVRRVTVPAGTSPTSRATMLGEAACAQVTDQVCVYFADPVGQPDSITLILPGGRQHTLPLTLLE